MLRPKSMMLTAVCGLVAFLQPETASAIGRGRLCGGFFGASQQSTCYTPANVCGTSNAAMTVATEETIAPESPYALRAPIMIQQQVRVRKTLPTGQVVEELRTVTRALNQTETIGYLREELEKLEKDVFGSESTNRVPSLEKRVKKIEEPSSSSSN